MTSNKPNGTTPPDHDTQKSTLENLEVDVAQLSLLLSQEPTSEAETEIAELLQRLESADGMARGVESRLDDILGNLDNILASLEPPGEDSRGVAQSAGLDGGLDTCTVTVENCEGEDNEVL